MDSSSVLDEPFSPPYISTPKKKRYECPYCSKSYVKQYYYRKHIESHTSQGQSTHDGSTLHLDVSELTFSALQTKDDTKVFKKPAPTKKPLLKNNVRKGKKYVCTYCLKSYVSENTMHKHMRIHTMEVASACFPDKSEILNNAGDIGEKALTKVANCPSYGDSGQLFNEFVGHVVSMDNINDFSKKILERILSVISLKKCILPSAIMKDLFSEMENISCDSDFCDDCMLLLVVPHYCTKDIQSQFMLEFLLNFTTEVFKFISTTFRKHYQRPLKAMPDLDVEDRQVIYYIGGSIMRGYFRIAFRHKFNIKWQTILNAVKNQVLCPEPVGDVDAAWTTDVDRGGLLYINEACQKFFISLTNVVYDNEKRDGSIDYEQVINIVCNSNVSMLWDQIIQDALPEQLSVGFMTDVITCFCKACGRGIARKKLNALRVKPVISMPTRHAVASRKK